MVLLMAGVLAYAMTYEVASAALKVPDPHALAISLKP